MARIYEPRVRETSDITGTGNIVLEGRMRGSLGFDDVMATGDTCDIVISYADSFEECAATFNASGELERGTCYRSLHANGTIDTSHVSFAAGVKTVIMVAAAFRAHALEGSLRFDQAQTLSVDEQNQVRENGKYFPSGTKMLFMQTAAPTGWTKLTVLNDRALRLVSGAASTGGVLSFSTVFGKTATDNFTLLHGHLPTVNLTISGLTVTAAGNIVRTSATATAAAGADLTFVPRGVDLGALGASIGGTLPLGGTNTPHAHPMDIRVEYADVIAATKD